MSYLRRTILEDQSPIIKLWDKFRDYWNDKNVDKMISLFTDNAEFTDIMGQIAFGKESIGMMHKMVFERGMKNAVMDYEILYMRDISKNQLLISCLWETRGHSNKESLTLSERKGLMQVIVSNNNNEWKISLIHNLDFTSVYNDMDNYQMKFLD